MPLIITSGKIGTENCTRDDGQENNTTFRCSKNPSESDYLNSNWSSCITVSVCVRRYKEFEDMSTKKENQYTRCNNTGPDFNIDAAIDGALSTWKGVCAGFSSGATKFNRSGECDQDYKNLATCSIQIDLTTDKDEWERITELPVGSTYGVTGKASGQKNRIMLNFTDILLDGGSNGSIRRWASPGGCSTLF